MDLSILNNASRAFSAYEAYEPSLIVDMLEKQVVPEAGIKARMAVEAAFKAQEEEKERERKVKVGNARDIRIKGVNLIGGGGKAPVIDVGRVLSLNCLKATDSLSAKDNPGEVRYAGAPVKGQTEASCVCGFYNMPFEEFAKIFIPAITDAVPGIPPQLLHNMVDEIYTAAQGTFAS